MFVGGDIVRTTCSSNSWSILDPVHIHIRPTVNITRLLTSMSTMITLLLRLVTKSDNLKSQMISEYHLNIFDLTWIFVKGGGSRVSPVE